jgi:hypothetical protein
MKALKIYAYIFDDRKDFLLMLEDISRDYYFANDINLKEMGNWLKAAESLTGFHSFYWNGANCKELKLLHCDNKAVPYFAA